MFQKACEDDGENECDSLRLLHAFLFVGQAVSKRYITTPEIRSAAIVVVIVFDTQRRRFKFEISWYNYEFGWPKLKERRILVTHLKFANSQRQQLRWVYCRMITYFSFMSINIAKTNPYEYLSRNCIIRKFNRFPSSSPNVRAQWLPSYHNRKSAYGSRRRYAQRCLVARHFLAGPDKTIIDFRAAHVAWKSASCWH